MAAAAPTDPQLSATTRKRMVARTAERVHVARVTLDEFVASAAALAADDAALLKRLRAAETARDRGVENLEEASAELMVRPSLVPIRPRADDHRVRSATLEQTCSVSLAASTFVALRFDDAT